MAFRELARGDFRDERGVHLQLAIEVRFERALLRALAGEDGRGLDFLCGRMLRAALGREGKHRHARTDGEELPREKAAGHGDVGELVHGRLGDDAAIRHEHRALVAEARVLDFQHHAARRRAVAGGEADDLEDGPQHAAGRLARAGHEAVGLAHRHHHRAEVVRLAHGVECLGLLHALGATEAGVDFRKALQLLALLRVDDADALEGKVESLGGAFDARAVAEEDGGPKLERAELPGRLQHARLGAFGEDHPLRVPLQPFDDAADETHGLLVADALADCNRQVRWHGHCPATCPAACLSRRLSTKTSRPRHTT